MKDGELNPEELAVPESEWMTVLTKLYEEGVCIESPPSGKNKLLVVQYLGGGHLREKCHELLYAAICIIPLLTSILCFLSDIQRTVISLMGSKFIILDVVIVQNLVDNNDEHSLLNDRMLSYYCYGYFTSCG